MYEFQTSLVSCPIAEMKHSDEPKEETVYSGSECKELDTGGSTVSSTKKQRAKECIIVQFPFSCYIVQDPGEGAVPPTIGGSSHCNYYNQDTPAGIPRGISQVILDYIS